MAKLIKDLRVHEISSVDRGAGDGVRVLLMKSETGDEMTLEDIAKAVKAAPDDQLPDVIEKLFEVPDYDPTKLVCDILQSRIVKRDGDRGEHNSYLKSFTGLFARDPVGRDILRVWKENDQRLSGISFAKRRSPKAMPDSGRTQTEGTVPAGARGSGAADDPFDKMVRAEMNASKCSEPQATAKVMKTSAGSEAYRKAREMRMITAAGG